MYHNPSLGTQVASLGVSGVRKAPFMGSEEEGPLPSLYVAPHHQVAASCILDFLLAKSAASKKIKLFSLPKLMLEVYNLPLDPIHCSEAIVRRHVFDIADVCYRLYQLVLR